MKKVLNKKLAAVYISVILIASIFIIYPSTVADSPGWEDNVNIEITEPEINLTKKVWNNDILQWVDHITAYDGEILHFRIDVYNDGPTELTNVIVTDSYPEFLTPFEINIPPTTFDNINRILTWNLGTINAYDTVIILLNATVSTSGLITTGQNIANVTCCEGSFDEDNVNIVTIQTIVSIDIKPGSCPNPLPTKSKGVLPVAICGTDVFDVTTIDPSTICLTREGYEAVGVSPLRWSYKDVATPYMGEECGCHDLNGDGYLDLTLKFKIQEVKNWLDLEDEMANTIPLIITGNLKEEFDSLPIEGQDCVWIINE